MNPGSPFIDVSSFSRHSVHNTLLSGGLLKLLTSSERIQINAPESTFPVQVFWWNLLFGSRD